mmetsp:Transcript_11466/g.24718  ORF Transcript_11466/g.24718 Transcript_11466/m.24718 type:complete len:111 (+) Transcript_11466:660-992(+)
MLVRGLDRLRIVPKSAVGVPMRPGFASAQLIGGKDRRCGGPFAPPGLRCALSVLRADGPLGPACMINIASAAFVGRGSVILVRACERLRMMLETLCFCAQVDFSAQVSAC